MGLTCVGASPRWVVERRHDGGFSTVRGLSVDMESPPRLGLGIINIVPLWND